MNTSTVAPGLRSVPFCKTPTSLLPSKTPPSRSFTVSPRPRPRLHGKTGRRSPIFTRSVQSIRSSILSWPPSASIIWAFPTSPPPFLSKGRARFSVPTGTFPLPAPATAEILRGIPLRQIDVSAELTTPTGAAILAQLVRHFGPLENFATEKNRVRTRHPRPPQSSERPSRLPWTCLKLSLLFPRIDYRNPNSFG